jgi:hypothetical protein
MAHRRVDDGVGSDRLYLDDQEVWLDDDDRARIVALLTVLNVELHAHSYTEDRPRWVERGEPARRELDGLGATMLCYKIALADQTLEDMGGPEAVADQAFRDVAAHRRREACWAWATVRRIPAREARAHFGIPDY